MSLDQELIDFISELSPEVILSIPGVYNSVKNFYSDVREVDVFFHNPAGVVKTKQDEKDWKKAKAYFARGSSISERHWSRPEWATVMVIYKNIKAKRKRGRR